MEPPDRIPFLIVQGLKDRVAPPPSMVMPFMNDLGAASTWRTFPTPVIWSSSSSPRRSPAWLFRFFDNRRRDPELYVPPHHSFNAA